MIPLASDIQLTGRYRVAEDVDLDDDESDDDSFAGKTRYACPPMKGGQIALSNLINSCQDFNKISSRDAVVFALSFVIFCFELCKSEFLCDSSLRSS